MAYFLVTSVWGPSRDATRGRREQDGWDEHAAFMDGLVEDGFVVLGGPVDDERAMLLVEAADEDEVRSRLVEDPWRAMGHARARRAPALDDLARPARDHGG